MITAIICAAGKGERAGFSQNKVLQELNGMPVLCYSLSAFAACGADEILVTCREEDEKTILPLLRPYPRARLVRGGETRGQSVYNALKAAKGDIVLVHDAARPFVTEKIITDCVECVKTHGSGICALPATDTTVIAEGGDIIAHPARETVYTVQTPQGFLRKELLSAYEQAFAEGRQFTDESGVYGKYIAPPRLFMGERSNKKLTYPEDFQPAERVGFGVDTHAFYAEGEGMPFINFITLGGVRIPSEKILKAHSDGDVLVHALMDALLSEKGLRDIGYYFPDTDEKYKGANSMELLGEVVQMTGKPQNVSISILAETPRLAPYIEEMKKSLSSALGIPEENIGIAAGTNERLGYIGEKKGITVYATVLL
ncbi:MAG: 2-C-methyl-D-erythritol 4-phosphate cytidylyltransferase [Clostridia bacterium]|nr:2-C-methyl-D-erythritol 4-phosphate cytidylyltransferase [Clostridia bacterium]